MRRPESSDFYGGPAVAEYVKRGEVWRVRHKHAHKHAWKRADDWDFGPGTVVFECVPCRGLRVVAAP